MLDELKDRFDALEEGRLALIRMVRDLPPDLLNRRSGPDDLERPAARHTVAGPLTVLESLGLLASHFDHHRRRIEAAVAQG